MITSTALTTATEDQAYSYEVKATDSDTEDQLTFLLTAGPAGMIIDATTGTIQWTPDNSQVGNHEVAILVEDTEKLTDTQGFTVT
ncbi:MAG: Ig domain-containing protein, partial [Chloroflexota bacterium]|nr:Ig domain-containing protein [Chloroflexota bacterium]